MVEPGLYALTKIIAGGLSAVLTGPLGSTDLPDINLRDALLDTGHTPMIAINAQDGASLGWAVPSEFGSPALDTLPVHFTEALLAIEDHRYGLHPGVDPLAVLSAGIDTLKGNPRGGSTLTQQLIKNAITGPAPTLDRKIREAILAIRAQSAWSSEDILHAYLANVWFGRGAKGASAAALVWFGKPWNEIDLHESAYLAGLLKGPAHHDPANHPERAMARRNLVISAMHDHAMISATDKAVAMTLPIDVIPEQKARALFDNVPRWISSGIAADLERYKLMDRSDLVSGPIRITTTLSPTWQKIAKQALEQHIKKTFPTGPAVNLVLPEIIPGDDLTGNDMIAVRKTATRALATSTTTGRAIITDMSSDGISVIIDRGYGPLEWETANIEASGYKPVRGDVLPFNRTNGKITVFPVPQVQGAVIVMNPATGAILASVGGHDATLFPFDRTGALRQPGSSIKPFLWARALEDGLRHDTPVADRERDYILSNGRVWHPVNYDHSQSGMIPLFVGLEESSNLVAARLIDRIGIPALASITEFAGIYDWGSMQRHRSAALGTSETTLARLSAGYAALANGGQIITPHRIAHITRGTRTLWTPPKAENTYTLASPETLENITAMLYGVTRRGTAYSAFRDFKPAVAGKTGTTEDYRDAWFMSFTPGIVIGVWIGRDDFTPIPGRLTGSRAAAPVARDIYQAAIDAELLQANGLQSGYSSVINWPPVLLNASPGQQAPEHRNNEIQVRQEIPEQVNNEIQVRQEIPDLSEKQKTRQTVIRTTTNRHAGESQPVKGLGSLLKTIFKNNTGRNSGNKNPATGQVSEPTPVLPNAPRSPESGLIFMPTW